MIIRGFELLDSRHVPEIDSRARLFRHVRTGARLLSMENTDENKVFGVTFSTPPPDSSGIAHILEHCVLCGSRKYPIKDPFMELMKGSLHTFLNAFTMSDRTCYPVASQNVQDYYNLIDVYMDAVLFPLLSRHAFRQEGWRYDIDTSNDRMVYQGVVYNEMKGVFSSPDALLAHYVMQSLFPDVAYRFDPGGDPQHIPDVSYERFKQFHHTYYHPSNARLFFYGDDDPDRRLAMMDSRLQDFEFQQELAGVQLQTRFAAPKRISRTYPAGQDATNGQKCMLCVNWLLDRNDDPERTLAWHVLQHALIGTPASPLYMALINSGLGEDLTFGGVESDLRQMVFSTGLKGVPEKQLDQVETLILETLAELVRTGIPPQVIASALNSIEFDLRERNTGDLPRGIAIMMIALSTWSYEADPLALLAFDEPLAAVKTGLREGGYLESMIRHALLENPHRTTVILRPDEDLAARIEANEAARLADLRADISHVELQAIVSENQELEQFIETPDAPEALAIIPRLKLSEINAEGKTIPIDIVKPDEIPILYHDLWTNGILYLDLGFNLRTLPQVYLPYVPLFGRALLETGTAKESVDSLWTRIGSQTGGIRTSVFASVNRGTREGVVWLFLRAKATSNKTGQLLDILKDVLTSARLDDQKRFHQIVLEEKSQLESDLAASGTEAVRDRLWAHFNEGHWANEQMNGISCLQFLRDLSRKVDTDWPAVAEDLHNVAQILINRSTMVCNATLDGHSWTHNLPQVLDCVEALPARRVEVTSWTPEPKPHREALLAENTRVNSVGKGVDLYSQGYRFHGSALVVANYLSNTWLWDRVRARGGAYDCFCQVDDTSGVLNFISHQDPGLMTTLQAYDSAGHYLRSTLPDEETLTSSIIGTIGSIDTYQLPEAKGYSSLLRHLVGKTEEIRQHTRQEILSTSISDFKAFADVLDQAARTGHVVVWASRPAIKQAEKNHPGWFEITKLE